MAGQTVLILVGPEYDDLEVWYPKYRLEAAGIKAPLAGTGESTYTGKYGYPCSVEGSVTDFDPATLTGVLAPGDWAPDKLRRDPAVLRLAQKVNERGGLIASICHGPWVLISAGIVAGKRVTGSIGVKDLTAFGEVMVGWLNAHKSR